MIIDAVKTKSSESSIALKSYTSVLTSMLTHDGITILTNKGSILGYHFFIKTTKKGDENVVGGARSRAFEAMKNSSIFMACFYKSQDGNIKIWKNNG